MLMNSCTWYKTLSMEIIMVCNHSHALLLLHTLTVSDTVSHFFMPASTERKNQSQSHYIQQQQTAILKLTSLTSTDFLSSLFSFLYPLTSRNRVATREAKIQHDSAINKYREHIDCLCI